MNNLSAHYGPGVDTLFAMYGHFYVRRPAHSPDFGPVEWGFNWILMFLRRHNTSIDENNLAEFIDHGADSLTGETASGFFADAGYYVCHRYPHMNYRPYGVS